MFDIIRYFFFLGLYYGMFIVLIFLFIVLNVFILNVYYKGLCGYKVFYCFKWVFFGIIVKMLFLKIDLFVVLEEGMVWYCFCLKYFFWLKKIKI